jgi:GTP-binding protein
MIIKNAKFEISSTKIDLCPQTGFPEYAFIGRSNVGKSSLINMLTGFGNLAKTSSTPGKTRLINHFIINDNWYLVDLPGYGYAKTSKDTKREFQQFISDYIMKREELECVFVLLDSRLSPQKIDLEFMNWLGEKGVPFVIVFTKLDKISSSQLNKNLATYKKEMLKTWENLPRIFLSSATSKTGRDEILGYIDEVNKMP